MNAEVYLECSAKYQENVEDIFREATKRALGVIRKQKNYKRRKRCAVLWVATPGNGSTHTERGRTFRDHRCSESQADVETAARFRNQPPVSLPLTRLMMQQERHLARGCRFSPVDIMTLVCLNFYFCFTCRMFWIFKTGVFDCFCDSSPFSWTFWCLS